jgi:hypothetical protein
VSRRGEQVVSSVENLLVSRCGELSSVKCGELSSVAHIPLPAINRNHLSRVDHSVLESSTVDCHCRSSASMQCVVEQTIFMIMLDESCSLENLFTFSVSQNCEFLMNAVFTKKTFKTL